MDEEEQKEEKEMEEGCVHIYKLFIQKICHKIVDKIWISKIIIEWKIGEKCVM